MMRMVWCLLAFGLLGLSINQLHAGAVPGGGNLQVVGEARNKLIPIALEGFAGEVAGVLKFDLEVMGCKVVPLADAAFVVRGKADGSVVGALTDKAGNPGFNRRYSGGNLRDQAHALSNDVIQALTGVPGIASTRVLFKMKTGPRAEEVFLSDYDGHKPVALTNDKTLVSAPRWSPDHSKVFYTTWLKRGGIENTTVIQQNMKTGEREVMARYRGLNTGGALSPQGFLAMILSRGGSPDVYVAPPGWKFMEDLKGQNLRRMCVTREEENGVLGLRMVNGFASQRAPTANACW